MRVLLCLSKPGRLHADVIAVTVADQGDEALKGSGLQVVWLLREVQRKLTAVSSLVQSLVASTGTRFHPSFLETALQSARGAKIQVSSAVDDLLAVRHVTVYAESKDIGQLLSKLHSGLDSVSTEGARKEIRIRGLVLAIETMMKPPLTASDETSAEHIGNVRLGQVKDFFEQFQASHLSKCPDVTPLKDELHHLDTLCRAIRSDSPMTEEMVKSIETGRTILSSKQSKLLKCVTALPLGVWLLEVVQDRLADHHARLAMVSGLDAAILDLSLRQFHFTRPVS